MLLYLSILLFTSLSVCSTSSKSFDFEMPERVDGLAPLFGLEHDHRIPDEFVVMFHENYTHGQHFDFIGKNISELDGYEKLGYGYTMNLSDVAPRDSVRRDPGVMLVETDQRVYLVDSFSRSPCEFRHNGSEV